MPSLRKFRYLVRTRFHTHVEALDLNEAEFLKGSSFRLNPNMTLAYGGHTYKFVGFAQPKWVIENIKSSCRD